MSKLLLAIALILLAQLPALASDFYDNPWKLRSPVNLKPASHAVGLTLEIPKHYRTAGKCCAKAWLDAKSITFLKSTWAKLLPCSNYCLPTWMPKLGVVKLIARSPHPTRSLIKPTTEHDLVWLIYSWRSLSSTPSALWAIEPRFWEKSLNE